MLERFTSTRTRRGPGATLFTVAALLGAPGVGPAQETAPPPAPRAPAAAGLVVSPAAPAAPQEGSYLGVTLRDVAADEVEEHGLAEPAGALVTRVLEDTPAARAGLREGDVIVDWNGESVESVRELRRLVAETPPEREVSVEIVRDGDRRQVDVVTARARGRRLRILEGGPGELGVMPAPVMPPLDPEQMEDWEEHAEEWREEWAERADEWREHAERWREQARGWRENRDDLEERLRAWRERSGDELEGLAEGMRELDDEMEVFVFRAGGHGRLGARVYPLTEQLARQLGVEGGEGVLVASVEDDSPAATAGIQAGDVIVAVDGDAVEGSGDLRRAVGRREDDTLELRLVRDGATRTLTVDMSAGEDEEAPGQN